MAHARAFAAIVRSSVPPGPVLDLGSGGGVPGLVLAAELPALHLTLLDASERRTAFLRRATDQLSLQTRVSVVRARAEEAGRDARLRASFAAVVSRGFGPPSVTAECAAPFLTVNGVLVVSEPPGSRGERWPTDGLAELKLRAEGIAATSVSLMVLRQYEVCPDRFPRRSPAKRPLF